MKILTPSFLIGILIWAAGCTSQVSFVDLDYNIPIEQKDVNIVVVIDGKTLNQEVSISSFSTGFANKWIAHPGLMMKQVSDYEFNYIFKNYQNVMEYRDPDEVGKNLTIVLKILEYEFANYRAKITVRAIGYKKGKKIVFDKVYSKNGSTQAGKMWGLGAWGMKSAVRQSSLVSFKTIFSLLRLEIFELFDVQ